jgi:two-component system sensor histidine kinase DesK
MNAPEHLSTPGAGKKRSPYLLWSIWVIWLPFFVPALLSFFQSHPSLPRLIISLAGAALFVFTYLWGTLRNAQRLISLTETSPRFSWQAWLTVALLTALSLSLTVNNGSVWGSLFIFTAAYAAGRLPTFQAALALLVLEAITLSGVLFGHLHWSDIASGLVLIAMVGIVVIGVVRSIATDRELRLAREEIARLAVTTERLRIARDLHDLLGHNLSLIALKSELAGRLLSVAPERAATEISDVEQVARSTLEEVREAVSNYRQPTLANELHAASEILAAAGIAYRYQGEESTDEALPASLEALLSWTVREGVTNVIRHSRARHCIIRATRTRQQAGIEILDDGTGILDQESASHKSYGGNGLRGLKERAMALGGQCETGLRATGGFRLAVSVPLTPGKSQESDEAPGQSVTRS